MSYELENDLGSFEGFNFRSQSAIYPNNTAQEVINWDHDAKGEAEFWPDGDHTGVSLVFRNKTAVCFSEIIALDKLISELGDEVESYLKIAYMLEDGYSICDLSSSDIEDENLHIFSGSSFVELTKEAAFELFELYFPEEYKVWEKSTCPGLNFDYERFLNGPEFSTSEYTWSNEKFLIIKPL